MDGHRPRGLLLFTRSLTGCLCVAGLLSCGGSTSPGPGDAGPDGERVGFEAGVVSDAPVRFDLGPGPALDAAPRADASIARDGSVLDASTALDTGMDLSFAVDGGAGEAGTRDANPNGPDAPATGMVVIDEVLTPTTALITRTWQGAVTVEVPGALLAKPTPLVVTTAPALPRLPTAGRIPVAAYDISLGDLHELALAVRIEIAYATQALAPGLAPAEQLAVGYWDAVNGSWVMLPDLQVDAARGVVSFTTRHLSLFSVFALNTGYRLNARPHFTIIYNPDLNAPYGGPELLAAIVGGYLEDAWTAYAGYAKPAGKIEVYLDDLGVEGSPSYNGTISVNAPYVDTLQELKFDMAHELFHAVQHARYGSLFAMWRVRWWVEATADYAAGRIASAINPVAGTEALMGEGIQARYLERTLDDDPEVGDRHKYHGAHFLDFLVRGGADFANIFSFTSDPAGDPTRPLTRLDDYLAIVSLGGIVHQYDAFARYFMFDPTSPLPCSGGCTLESLAAYWTAFGADRTDITGTMTFPGFASAKLWGLPVALAPGETTRNLVVEPSGSLGDARVYVGVSADGTRSPTGLQGPLADGSKTRVEVPSGATLLVFAVAGSTGASVALKVRDPAPIITAVAADPIDALAEFTITGSGFGTTPGAVLLRTIHAWDDAMPIVSWSDTKIVALAKQEAGSGALTIETSDGFRSRSHAVAVSDLWLLQKMGVHDLLLRVPCTYTDTLRGGTFAYDSFPKELPVISGRTLTFSGTTFGLDKTETVGETTYRHTVAGEVDGLGTRIVRFDERWTATSQRVQGACTEESTSVFELSLVGANLYRQGAAPADANFLIHAGGGWGGELASLVSKMRESTRVTWTGEACPSGRDFAFVSAAWSPESTLEGILLPAAP